MIEVRWHGRGGQGVVTSSALLAHAANMEGKYAIHIPEFGPERRGAPVRSYTRINTEPIEIRYGVLSPDVVVVIDPSLLKHPATFLEGLKDTSMLILNHPRPAEAKKIEPYETYVVDAYHISLDTLGRPIYNTAMLGALVGATNVVSLDSIRSVLISRFGEKLGEANWMAAKRSYEEVRRVG